MAGGIATIYAVATRPCARNLGVGTALTKQSMLVAKQLGFHYSVLQASEMGHSIYKKLGFKEFCAIDLYVSNQYLLN